MSKFAQLLNNLGINETLTKSIHQPVIYDKVKDNIPPIEGLNFEADLQYFPTDKKGYHLLLVICDLASDAFDIEPLKNKDAKTILQAFNTILHRGLIKVNDKTASIRTDNGTEFKSLFDEQLWKQNILHSVGQPYRHKQTANVESLNRQLARLMNGYMNAMEKKTHKPYREWTDIVDYVRKELNNIRMKKTETTSGFIQNAIKEGKQKFSDYLKQPIKTVKKITTGDGDQNIPDLYKTLVRKPKFNVGDLVHVKLDYPENALGYKQNTPFFRMGDYRFTKFAKPIMQVLPYDRGYRYIVGDNKNKPNYNVSYAQNELVKSEQHEELHIVKRILKKRIVRGQTQYLIQFKDGDKQWKSEDELWDNFYIMINRFNGKDDDAPRDVPAPRPVRRRQQPAQAPAPAPVLMLEPSRSGRQRKQVNRLQA